MEIQREALSDLIQFQEIKDEGKIGGGGGGVRLACPPPP